MTRQRRSRGAGVAPASDRAEASDGEGGFGLIESVVALGTIFAVLVGLVAAVDAGVRGVVGGRQRTGAVTVAQQVVEQARAALYQQVGHDLANDATLSTDPEVSGNPKTYRSERLVGAARPLYPVHTWTTVHDSTPFTVTVYATWVTSGSAASYKRLTVRVGWNGPRVGTSNSVTVSSLIFNAGVPPDPSLIGSVRTDGGTVRLAGTLNGVSLANAFVFSPSAEGTLTSQFVRRVGGSARTASGEENLNGTGATGCQGSGTSSSCPGLHVETATDNDAATMPPPENDAKGPVYDVGGTITAGSALTINLGTGGSAQSKSTSRSCFACYSVPIGDDDRLGYHQSQGVGPGSVDMRFDVGAVTGSLYRTTASAVATSLLDQNASGGYQRLATNGHLTLPSVDLVMVNGGPAGYTSAVNISSADVQAEADAGPGVGAPSVTGGAITLALYDTISGSPGYRNVTIQPGQAYQDSASVSFVANGATVAITTSVTSGGKAVSSTTNASGVITHAQASLTNWLRIDIALKITSGSSVLADTQLGVDAGQVSATADYQTP